MKQKRGKKQKRVLCSVALREGIARKRVTNLKDEVKSVADWE